MSRIIILALCLSMTGCLFTVDSKQKVGYSQWSAADTDRIRIGQTDADWLQRTFGPPRRESTYADGTRVLRYDNISESESRVGLFLLFNVNVEKEHAETLVVELKQDIVSDFWVEKR